MSSPPRRVRSGVDGQLCRGAEVLEIGEDALDALLVELVVLAERDEVAQSLLPVEALGPR